MNRRQSDKYSSLMSSLDWLKDNAAVVAGLASVPAHAADLQTTMDRLGWLMALVRQDSSGYAMDKAQKREQLMAMMMRISRYALAYYIVVGNAEKQKAASFTIGSIRQMSGANLYVFAGKLYDVLLPDAPLMPGSAPADIGILAVDIATFYAVINSPATVRATRKDAVAETLELFAHAEATCQTIELFMRTLIGTDDFSYDIWRASRKIYRTGVRTKKKKE